MPFACRNMLMLGRSKSWTQALETISGDNRMDAKALLNYFEKLHIWLKKDNDKHNRLRGWKTPSGFSFTLLYLLEFNVEQTNLKVDGSINCALASQIFTIFYLFYFLVNENAVKVRISLRTALGDNAVSVDFFRHFNFDCLRCIWQQRANVT